MLLSTVLNVKWYWKWKITPYSYNAQDSFVFPGDTKALQPK